jgi:hypothetical protein
VTPRRLALIALLMAGGLLIVAAAANRARDDDSGAYLMFWAGLVVIFVPAFLHAWRGPSRGECLAVVALLGIALYLVKVIHSPLQFTFHDEFATLRVALDIERFGQSFHDSPLVSIYPFYPAVELVTSAISSLSGMSVFLSGLIVIGVMRAVLMLSLFAVFEVAAGPVLATGRGFGRATTVRVAAIATVLYAANPNFVFFDAQWAYESFALPLAFATFAVMARAPASPRGTRASTAVAVLLLLGVLASHPLTAYALVVLLVVWSAIDTYTARRRKARPRRELWLLGALGAAGVATWTLAIAPTTGGYLGPVVGQAGSSFFDLLGGGSGPKEVFAGAGVAETPVIERLLGFGSVGLALLAIPVGLWHLRQRPGPLPITLGLIALLYPLTLALRLTEAGTEVSNRASEFVFLGIAFLAALALTGPGPLTRARPALRQLRWTAAIAAAAAVLFVGGVVVGWAHDALLPGPYLVVADPRSVEREGVEAAHWVRGRLGSGNRIVTDRSNGLLLGSFGLQEPRADEFNGQFLPRLITASHLNRGLRRAVRDAGVSYLVVDRRLATALPLVGYYFQRTEPNAFGHRRPPREKDLLKYDHICPVDRIFDSGNIVVYDTRRVRGGVGCAHLVGSAG